MFLQNAAVPVFQQAAGALKAEGYPFVVNTPAGSVRLVSEHSSHDFIDLRLDTTGARPQVLIRVERMKGRETTSEERPLKPGADVDGVTEQDVLDAIAEGLWCWSNDESGHARPGPGAVYASRSVNDVSMPSRFSCFSKLARSLARRQASFTSTTPLCTKATSASVSGTMP